MVAIETKYLAPTNSRGARIKASTCTGFTATIPYPYTGNAEGPHYEAVKALVKKHNLDWPIENMRFGGTERGYVFCFDMSRVEPCAN